MSVDIALDRYPIAFLRPRIKKPYAWVGHIPFVYVLMDMLRPERVVELGTDSGNSYLAICQAVEHLGLPARCTAVDSWRGDAHAGAYGDDVYRTLRAYHDPRYGGFSTLMRAWFDDAVHAFENGSIDLLHIDGLHTYDAVRNDFETWLPKLSDRAVVLFHDSAVLDRGFGVRRFIDELAQTYRIFCFHHSNGLSVAQVGADPKAEIDAFLRLAAAEPERIRAYFEAIASGLLAQAVDASGASAEAEPNVVCKLYYRDIAEGYDEARSMVFALLLSPDNDRALCSFEMPAGFRPDIVRIDPANAPGVFGLSGVTVEAGEGRGHFDVDLTASRILSMNGAQTPPLRDGTLRLVSFDDDPWYEVDLRDVWPRFPAEESLTLSFDLIFEAVLFDPRMQRAAGLQQDAIVELRKRTDLSADIARLSAATHARLGEIAEKQRQGDAQLEHVRAETAERLDRNAAALSVGIDAIRQDSRLDMLTQSFQRLSGETHERFDRLSSEIHPRIDRVEAELAEQARWRQEAGALLHALVEHNSRRRWHQRMMDRMRAMIRRMRP